MDSKCGDNRVTLAVEFLLLAGKCNRKQSVTDAMDFAGFTEAEIRSSGRAKEFAVRRAYKGMKKKMISINLPIQEVDANSDCLVSPLSNLTLSTASNSTTISNTTDVKKTSREKIPGIQVVRQTSHQVHVAAQNSLVIQQLRNSAIKEATAAWKVALELKLKGEPYETIKQFIESINNKPQYKGHVKVAERSIRRYVSTGLAGLSPPRNGSPGNIPQVAYIALKDALTSFISIHQASGEYEYTRSKLSHLVNDVINNHPNENRTSDKLIARLQRDFGPEFHLGKKEKVEERRVKWTTFNNLISWGDKVKDIIIELGFGRLRQPEDNVEGEIYFYEGQLERIINFDETRITLDQTETQRGGRPSFVFYNPKKPRPGSSTNKSSVALTLIVGGTAAGELIPPHFQLVTESLNDEVQTWNTNLSRFIHDVYGKFGYENERYHPCTFGMNAKGGMNKDEFEEYVKNSLVTLYPDAADAPRKRVLLKADSGPGRKNTDLMAYLRVRGFYFIPGLPNSTHVSQEMELLIGELKSSFYLNLEQLTRGCLEHNRPVPSGVEIVGLLLFGGLFDYGLGAFDEFINAVQKAGSNDKIQRYFEKIGFAPFTRAYLNNKHVRHEFANDPMAEEYCALEYTNALACGLLDVFGYNGSLLSAQVSRKARQIVEQSITRPATMERAKALASAATHGQQFKVTGGHHLTSDDFFVADALLQLEKEQKAMTLERRARQKYQQQYENALPLLNKPENTLLSKDLDILLRYKLGELPGNLKTKSDKLQRWQEEKNKPNSILAPWSEEEEERYWRLMEKEISINDTALERQKKIFQKQLLSSIGTISDEDCRAIRKALDDRDARV